MGVFNGSLVEYDYSGLQNLAAVTGSSVASAVISTGMCLVVPETDVYMTIGTNPTASSTTGVILTARIPFDVICNSDEKVAVRAVDTDGAVKILPARLT